MLVPHSSHFSVYAIASFVIVIIVFTCKCYIPVSRLHNCLMTVSVSLPLNYMPIMQPLCLIFIINYLLSIDNNAIFTYDAVNQLTSKLMME